MNVFLALLYGGTIYLAAIAYTLITHGPVGWVLLAGPFIVSGAIVVLLALDWAVRRVAGKVRDWRNARA